MDRARRVIRFQCASVCLSVCLSVCQKVFSLNCGHGSRPWTTQIVRLGFSGVILCELPSCANVLPVVFPTRHCPCCCPSPQLQVGLLGLLLLLVAGVRGSTQILDQHTQQTHTHSRHTHTADTQHTHTTHTQRTHTQNNWPGLSRTGQSRIGETRNWREYKIGLSGNWPF